jgi:hypothetical protein
VAFPSSVQRKSGVGAATSNVAVTAVAAVGATTQVEVPEQAPDQPANVEVDVGVAVKVTVLP